MPVSTSDKSIWQALTGNDPEAVRPWLRWHPAELDACVEARTGAMPSPLDDAELSAMIEAHERWGADEPSLENVRRLASGHSRVVVSGQQPGLLGGPLYTLYKALGSVKLAALLSERHTGLAFVPVFWVASEDHDFEEVAMATWPQAGGELTKFRADHTAWQPGRMVGTLPAEPVIESLIDAIREGTHETEFRAAELDRLRGDAEGASWEDLFCRTLLRLTQGTGLALISPLMPWVRERSKKIFRREIQTAGGSTRLILERTAEMEEAGLQTPLHRSPEAVNFFHVDTARCRRPVRLENGQLSVPTDSTGTAESSTRKETWLDELASDPERFSTNVVTRPLTQDSILPTVAQLVGPGEAAYFAQVEAVYESFGVFAPVRFPRPQALLVPRNVERTLKKYDLEALNVIRHDVQALVQNIQRAAGDDGFADRLSALRERQRNELKEFQQSLGNGGAAGAAIDRLIQAMEKGYETVDQRFRDDRRQQAPQLEAAMNKLLANLAPEGAPQERVFNPVVPFLVTYGPSWIERLRDALTAGHGDGLQVIRL